MMEQLVALTPGALRTSLDAVVESGQALLRDRELLMALDGLFEKALRTPGLTAWVCANDDVARIAWNWLDGRGIAVGRDLALVGFDNTMSAQTAGLTSMSFLEDDLASSMVSYLLDPGHWRSNGVVSLVGSLVVRGSTGVPRPVG
jgi:DNA-binding LacI/PurR family transcriptional regulator